ncbi:UDP-3-O-[3-hydroxymyristoyl] N-acetylglucosamine deacetylase [Holospora obtusa F1]|uniref:UDP-3-O-acyl-N-acetylglucosamine deacetylase n=1 Tax=Holospora obtusa F1 TaxID=1399147 RepID=W6TFC7_HOLOB|nr:UDP-3-O-acyl-N-acetylglucosamine deacetylase [Holospora obtusa]ETZ06700.1 UDP-3-O-[3-hydroxymyristoyl] N-acetylglucosamine deacetylase [Holospora obtusa F1]
MYQYRKTIRNMIEDEGVAIHSGVSTSLRLIPAPSGSGICFRRSGVVYPLHPRYIEVKNFHTVLKFSSTFSVHTVEHLLAACCGVGITDLIVETSQEELPFFDGSALHFVQMLESAGIQEFEEESEYIVLKEAVCVLEGNSRLVLEPAGVPMIHVNVPISSCYQEEAHFSFLTDDFNYGIAPARTFSKFSEIEYMRQRGLIQGGNLGCAVVLEEDGTALNPEGFRLPQECARHKILDILGDLMILGSPCVASIYSYAPGHSRNLKAVQLIAKNADSHYRLKYSELKALTQLSSEKKTAKYAF